MNTLKTNLEYVLYIYICSSLHLLEILKKSYYSHKRKLSADSRLPTLQLVYDKINACGSFWW